MNPNFFIIGAPKTGTSSLAQYLSEHEKIFFSQLLKSLSIGVMILAVPDMSIIIKNLIKLSCPF